MKEVKTIKGKGLFGLNKTVKNDLIGFTSKTALENLPIVGIKLAHKILYITADADLAAAILVKETEKFNRGLHYKRLSIIGGNGLITSEGEYWKRQRRLAQPGFHRNVIQGFLSSFIEFAYEVDAKWENQVGEELKMMQEMSAFTLKAASLTLYSADLTNKYPLFRTYLKELLRFLSLRQYDIIRIPLNWPIPKHQRFWRNLKYLNNAIYSYIDQRIESSESQPDLLEMFLSQEDTETGEKMTRLQIRDEFFTMLVAGYETSSVALTWAWYALNKYPDFATKVRQEIEEVIGDKKVEAEHLPKLSYTKMFISETMRLYPPIFAIPRSVDENTELFDYELKGGNPILISVYAMNRNPAYWESPDEFNPENFSEENKAKRHKHAFLPFGTGQRMCIGSEFAMYEILAMLAVLVRKYKPIPRPGYHPKMLASTTTDITEAMPMIMKRFDKT